MSFLSCAPGFEISIIYESIKLKAMKFLNVLVGIVIMLCISCNGGQQESAVVETDNSIVETTVENIKTAWNTSDAALFKSISVENFIRNTNGVIDARNQDEYLTKIGMFKTAFSNMKIQVDKYEILDRNAYVHWTFTGTNDGPYFGNAPTGKDVVSKGFSVYYMNDEGKVVHEDAFFDNLTLLQQMGYGMPAPPATD